MSQRTRTFLLLALLAFGAAFVLQLLNLFLAVEQVVLLRKSDVSGVAIEFHGQLYTLSFEQQNQFLDALNQSLPTTREEMSQPSQKPPFDKLIIYRIGNSPIEVVPVAFYGKNLVFLVPALNPQELRMETTEGMLQLMLLHSYDDPS